MVGPDAYLRYLVRDFDEGDSYLGFSRGAIDYAPLFLRDLLARDDLDVEIEKSREGSIPRFFERLKYGLSGIGLPDLFLQLRSLNRELSPAENGGGKRGREKGAPLQGYANGEKRKEPTRP